MDAEMKRLSILLLLVLASCTHPTDPIRRGKASDALDDRMVDLFPESLPDHVSDTLADLGPHSAGTE